MPFFDHAQKGCRASYVNSDLIRGDVGAGTP